MLKKLFRCDYNTNTYTKIYLAKSFLHNLLSDNSKPQTNYIILCTIIITAHMMWTVGNVLPSLIAREVNHGHDIKVDGLSTDLALQTKFDYV